MAKRYDQMQALILNAKPRSLVEIGVHRGARAHLMARWALASHKHRVTYTGYDVFGTVGEQFHAEALNGKGAPNQRMAEYRLSEVEPDRFGFSFVVGDTRETLHGRLIPCDFAFIDGDHRVEAIRGDAAALDCPLMVFDDYYLAGPAGELPDLEHYGANKVVDEYLDAGFSVELLPHRDRCDHGAYAVLAVVRR